MLHTERHTAHASALIIDRRHYVTCARNELLELRYVRASKRYMLHTASASYALDYDSACYIFAAVVRHTARISKCSSNMRNSVYTLRSDIRSLVRTIECAKFAH